MEQMMRANVDILIEIRKILSCLFCTCISVCVCVCVCVLMVK